VAVEDPGLEVGRKTILLVLFVPSVERDGVTAINQEHWVDEMGGVLVKDQPVVLHCYTTPADIADPNRLVQLGSFCRRMGREAHQGEVGLVIGDEYLAFRDFSKE
jgi:hypothetical protein